jgi:multiple sugar transport system permease protein
LSAVLTFKAFDHIFVMTRGGPARGTQVLPLYTYDASFGTYQFRHGAAASVLLMVIPFILGLLYIRRLRVQEDVSTGRPRRVWARNA